jgi:hypothetical protein
MLDEETLLQPMAIHPSAPLPPALPTNTRLLGLTTAADTNLQNQIAYAQNASGIALAITGSHISSVT